MNRVLSGILQEAITWKHIFIVSYYNSFFKNNIQYE